MQPLDLNLAANPFRNNTLLWLGYCTTTFVLAGFTVWNVSTFLDHRTRLRDLREEVGTFESQRLDLETRAKRALDGIRRVDVKALELQTAKANEVIEWKAFSWTRLFNTLEQVQPHHVRMTGVRPIFSVSEGAADEAVTGGSGMPVALEGVARNLDDFAELVGAMQEEPSIGRVEPDRLTRTDAGELVFQMHVWYLFPEEAEARAAAEAAAESAEAPDGAQTPAGEGTNAPAPGIEGADEAAAPEVDEPWSGGEPAGAGEVQSATQPALEAGTGPVRPRR